MFILLVVLIKSRADRERAAKIPAVATGISPQSPGSNLANDVKRGCGRGKGLYRTCILSQDRGMIICLVIMVFHMPRRDMENQRPPPSNPYMTPLSPFTNVGVHGSRQAEP